MRPLILASGSQPRRWLLERLNLDFTVQVSGVDETLRDGESAAQLVKRLAPAKARAVAAIHPEASIIGADQVACADHTILGKPANVAAARRQLALCSGKAVEFHTGVCLLDAASGDCQFEDVLTTVHFRTLSDDEISRYVECEKPLKCAGSFRSEALGSTLLERIESDDPTALPGLPLITLSAMLRRAGWTLP